MSLAALKPEPEPEEIIMSKGRARQTNDLLTLGDFFDYGRDGLLPEKPCSPYRYIEFLTELTMQKKYGLRKVLEIGPGTDPGLAHLDPKTIEKAAAMDYVAEALAIGQKRTPHLQFEQIAVDVMQQPQPQHKEQWDYIICNSVIEHVVDDQKLVDIMHDFLKPGGYIVCSTVMHQFLYCSWDYAVGHYRRYSKQRLLDLFSGFSEVQVVQTSLLQELARPLFFKRIYPLCGNTLEANNLKTAIGHQEWGQAPYAPLWSAMKYAMPLWLAFDWLKGSLPAGIGFVIARR